MKKTLLGLFVIFVIIIGIVLSKYYEYKQENMKIKEFNLIYEEYLDKEIRGTDIITIINKAVDNNEKNEIQKDENNKYIKNDINSINIEIKMNDLEEEQVVDMETFYFAKGGMTKFAQYYNSIYFKSADVKYNKEGKICYILFEQISS